MPNFSNSDPSYWAKLADPKNLPSVASADDWMKAINASRQQALAAQGGGAAQHSPQVYRSSDGLVTYNSRGQRLDSLGHIAYGDGPLRRRGGGGGGGGGAPTPVAGSGGYGAYPVSAITGQPLPLPVSAPMTIPFVDQAFASPGIAGPGQAPVTWPELNDAMMQRALAYYNAALPWVQTNINAYQNQRDFGETQRRFNLEFPQRQAEAGFAAAGRAQLPNARYVSYR